MVATYLYVDMADSTKLLSVATFEQVAAILRIYLEVTVRIVRENKGHVRSFDGDRVMGVFSGPGRHDRAVKSSLQIYYAVINIVRPAMNAWYPGIKAAGWDLSFASGIAESTTTMIRVGIRDNSDLVSIGLAANLAAKLSELRQGLYVTFIEKAILNVLSAPLTVSNGALMWEGPLSVTLGGASYSYYRSKYSWKVLT
jgi:adenylate cyclase